MNIENYLFQIPPHKIKLGLDRTEKLLSACGNPQDRLYSIQIIGTNGKGSTSSILSNVIKKKYKVGLFTSPHLIDYKERIMVNYKKIDEKNINFFLKKYKVAINQIQPSFFEIMTVLSLWYFNKKKVDVAILETGLGGRLDSVTACCNSIAVFTNIDLDHQSILGKTVNLIAKEKVAAINSNTQHVFSVEQKLSIKKIIISKAVKKKLKPRFISNNFKKIRLQYLHGRHQQINASLAYAVIKFLAKKRFPKMNLMNIKKEIIQTKWPGRFQEINKNPRVIFDVAHNISGLKSFSKTLKLYIDHGQFNRKILVCAFEHNKEISSQVKKLKSHFDEIICTETGIKKSMCSNKLVDLFDSTKATQNKNIKNVFKQIVENKDSNQLICIIGSHYFGPHINELYNKSFAKI